MPTQLTQAYIVVRVGLGDEDCDVCLVHSRRCDGHLETELVSVKLIMDGGQHEISALLDIGSLHHDFISHRLVKKLNLQGTPANTLVCTGLHNQCSKAAEKIAVTIEIQDECSQQQETIELHLLVVEHDIDVIIGKPTVRRLNLMERLDTQIWASVDGLIQAQGASDAAALKSNCHPKSEDTTSDPCFIHTTFSKGLYFNEEDAKEQLDIEAILDDFDLNQTVEDDSKSDEVDDVLPTKREPATTREDSSALQKIQENLFEERT